MATPAPGVLLKLLDGMNMGSLKPVGEHRTAVLQVTDIVPAELDERDLWPRQGRFYVKVSDSSHSVYAALPADQSDLVLSNRLQLGQFVQVERLEPGSPVPVLRGAKLIPGRHPLMGTPEPIIKVQGSKGGTGSTGAPAMKFGGGNSGSSTASRRGSWDMEPASLAVKGTILDFEETTPVRVSGTCIMASSPASTRGRSAKEGNGSSGLLRASVGGSFLSKVAADSVTTKAEGSALPRQSCAVATRFTRSKSVCGRESRIPRSPFHGEKKGSITPPPRARPEPSSATPANADKENPNRSLFSRLQSTPQPSPTTTAKNGTGTNRISLPGKLGAIGKEVMRQREEAQKIALQALRDASAAETLVRVLRKLSHLSSSARADSPARCFDQFLSFHQEITQAISDMEAIYTAAVSASKVGQSEEDTVPPILHEIQPNPGNMNAAKRRTTTAAAAAAAASKAISFLADPNELQKAILGKHPRSSSRLKDSKKAADEEEAKVQNSTSTFANSIRTAKQIQLEAGNWFIEFLDAALESGLKKARAATASTNTPKKDHPKGAGPEGCSQSLMLKVINWVEVEQCDNTKKPLHPRAAQVARKLRIKVKNP